jgi:phosphonate degradation associated HDIG domain protein
VNARSVDEVVALYEAWGHDRYDEDVTQLDHALQTAALAAADDAPDALVVAALLHDVGHLLELRDGAGRPGSDDLHHESRGAKYLSGVFSTAVTIPIALHVRAKRYLCGIDPGYHSTLSEGSKRSLERQGGLLSEREQQAFEELPGWDEGVRLRRWDDLGKADGVEVHALDTYRPLLVTVSRR